MSPTTWRSRRLLPRLTILRESGTEGRKSSQSSRTIPRRNWSTRSMSIVLFKKLTLGKGKTHYEITAVRVPRLREVFPHLAAERWIIWIPLETPNCAHCPPKRALRFIIIICFQSLIFGKPIILVFLIWFQAKPPPLLPQNRIFQQGKTFSISDYYEMNCTVFGDDCQSHLSGSNKWSTSVSLSLASIVFVSRQTLINTVTWYSSVLFQGRFGWKEYPHKISSSIKKGNQGWFLGTLFWGSLQIQSFKFLATFLFPFSWAQKTCPLLSASRPSSLPAPN
jgi:hypothetical protein